MIIFHAIRHTADEHWHAFKAIYQQSFPVDEQRPIDDIVRLMNEEVRYTVMALVDDCNQCIGILTTWGFYTYMYIEHFAIAPAQRAKGYGTIMLCNYMDSLSIPIVLEVEPPTDNVSQRRIAFYERCGLKLYDYHYIQPAYSSDRSPVTLRLMGTLVQPNLPQIAHTLHSEVYGIKIPNE